MKTASESTRICPKCGAPVPADAPRGLCPRCVLAGAATATDAAGPATATGEIPSLERVRAAFPNLEVLELIGRGGMGFVFKARQPRLDRLVALKLLPDKLARDPQFAERFNREGRVLARLNHPTIVSVFDFGRTEHFYFLLMEFVDGVNLRQAMRAGRFTPAEALAIVPRICEALQYAHDQGVLHRDIKPENILLDARGRVKIADFGIAKLVGDDQPSVTLTGTGAALGTPHYMAPEQLERPAEVDHRADIYSLGVVFYEMLTGELPLGRFGPPSAKTPVGPQVDEVVFRTLERDREKRYQSAGEVQTEVEQLTGKGAAEGRSAPAALAATGPGGTRVTGPEVKPQYSFRAFAGAALVGASLVVPLTVLVALITGHGGVSPMEIWLSLGSVAMPGLGGTLVGWLALNEIREGGGTVRGLPLALFATLTWPLLALVATAVGGPVFLLGTAGGSGWSHGVGRALLLALPAAVLTFALWGVYATARWATQPPKARERGVLKWIYAGLLVSVMGFVLVSRPVNARIGSGHPTPDGEATAPLPEGPGESERVSEPPSNWIRFTFTAVELREDAQGQWLTFDYVDDVHGDCETAFRWEANVPGFVPQTRATAFRTDPKGGSPAVRHQRVEFRMPDWVDRATLLRFRDDLAEGMVRKSVVAQVGEDTLVFRLPIADRGTLAGWIGARTPLPRPGQREVDPAILHALQQRVEAERGRLAEGHVPILDVARAERDLARAQAAGNPTAAARAQLDFADLALAEARRQGDPEEVARAERERAEAEHALACAQAEGDPVGVARADLGYAAFALDRARRGHQSGSVSLDALRQAETDLALAEGRLRQLAEPPTGSR